MVIVFLYIVQTCVSVCVCSCVSTVTLIFNFDIYMFMGHDRSLPGFEGQGRISRSRARATVRVSKMLVRRRSSRCLLLLLLIISVRSHQSANIRRFV